jgi:hypothetical protein
VYKRQDRYELSRRTQTAVDTAIEENRDITEILFLATTTPDSVDEASEMANEE